MCRTVPCACTCMWYSSLGVHKAARQLGLPSFGLAHLLQTFCDFTADKKHQLSDWRMRPLPADMLK